MMARHSAKRRPRIVGVIASGADLERALRMRRLPDLFELRLDRLAGMADQVENARYRNCARRSSSRRDDPHEGGANKLRLRQRRDLLRRFLNHADYIDVELRSARALQVLARDRRKRKRSGKSFHSTISNRHRARESWRRKRAKPDPMAQIFSKLLREPIRRWNSDVCSNS